MLNRKRIDSDKEIELIATVSDFERRVTKIITPTLEPEGLTEQRKKLQKIAELLEEIISFNIYSYNGHVSKKLYSTCLKIRRSSKEYLIVTVRIHKAMLDGTARSDPAKLKQLIDSLSNIDEINVKKLEKQVKKAIKRYTKQHGHGLQRDILTFSVAKKDN